MILRSNQKLIKISKIKDQQKQNIGKVIFVEWLCVWDFGDQAVKSMAPLAFENRWHPLPLQWNGRFKWSG